MSNENDDLDGIVSAYIDRLVSGEMLDQEEIEKAHRLIDDYRAWLYPFR